MLFVCLSSCLSVRPPPPTSLPLSLSLSLCFVIKQREREREKRTHTHTRERARTHTKTLTVRKSIDVEAVDESLDAQVHLPPRRPVLVPLTLDRADTVVVCVVPVSVSIGAIAGRSLVRPFAALAVGRLRQSCRHVHCH